MFLCLILLVMIHHYRWRTNKNCYRSSVQTKTFFFYVRMFDDDAMNMTVSDCCDDVFSTRNGSYLVCDNHHGDACVFCSIRNRDRSMHCLRKNHVLENAEMIDDLACSIHFGNVSMMKTLCVGNCG
jgi:hypothetical protein